MRRARRFLGPYPFGVIWRNHTKVQLLNGENYAIITSEFENISRPIAGGEQRRAQVIINIQDDILKLHALGLLDGMLLDKTTKQHIMWATGAYASLGGRYEYNGEITPDLITGEHASVIKTRARKAMEQQSARTRQHAEVFTPLWMCRMMNDYADEVWFGAKEVFFKDGTPTAAVGFPKGKRWERYVDSRRLEITCGEAPYLVSRYDVETGEAIPIRERVGLLDRKLRVVGEKTQTEEEWLEWAARAFWATYGYEFQGDNVLIARVNLLMTFEEYLQERWKRKPTRGEYEKIANIITWNIWQMDGLTGTVPYGTPEEQFQQMDLFGMLEESGDEDKKKQPHCLVHNWTGGGSVEFLSLPVKGKKAMKFDFIIGNPPYQEEIEGSSDRPIYNAFMDAVYEISDKVELITPARFLFNAGKTPKAWNQKMMEDIHLKVLFYERDSSKIFPNTNINGGIAITYRDASKNFGAIEVFSPYDELRSIQEKGFKNFLSEVEASALSDTFWTVTLPQNLETSSVNSPAFNVFLAAQVHLNYNSLLMNGIKVSDLITVAGDIHHIFPRAYLKKNGIDSKTKYNQVANYIYLDTQVNKAISDDAPCDYFSKAFMQCETKAIELGNICNLSQLNENLQENCIPLSVKNMDASSYEEFLTERRKLMAFMMKRYYWSL